MATKRDISYWGVTCEMGEPVLDFYGGSCVGEVCEREVCGEMLAELSWKRLCESAAVRPQRPCLLKAMGSDTSSHEEVAVKTEPGYPLLCDS